MPCDAILSDAEPGDDEMQAGHLLLLPLPPKLKLRLAKKPSSFSYPWHKLRKIIS